MINLTIKTLDSQNHKFKVPNTFTILQLKEHIAEKVNVAVVQQRLIFCGRVLNNETKLADIDIDGKVMHLVQKVPRLATTTTSGSSASTTTNTNSRAGQNGGPGFRGWHTHDPTVLFSAIGIPSEVVHAGEISRLLSARPQGTSNRILLALDMIRRSNDILNRLEDTPTVGRSSATDVEQFSEGSQSAEDILLTGFVPPQSSVPESSVPESSVPESSVPQTQSDSQDSVNVSYEVDETFPNTVVVTIDATHHMRMPPDLMRQMHEHLQSSHSHQISPEQTVESEATTVVPETPSVISTNQSSAEQAAGTLPSSATSGQNSRNDRYTSGNRPTAINDRRRLKDLVEQLHKLNIRLQPFYILYCRYLNDDPQFESTESENVNRAQAFFNDVSEVMHYISHVYHAISDLRVSFNRPPPRSVQSRPCLLQGTILHAAHTVTTAPPPSIQQPTSTQTTTTSQSIPSVRAFRLDFMSPEEVGSENPNVSTSATSTESNTNMTANPTIENNRSLDFSTDSSHGVELMFDLTPGTIHIDSVEAEFVSPNTSGSTQPTTVSQPSGGREFSTTMPIEWMDQMIDVISSGARRPFMSDQSLDWGSIPTTSTRTPRVTPRSTDYSSINPPSQIVARGGWDTESCMDPFLPCSSHHFESFTRPMVLGRRSTQGTERPTSSANNGGGSTVVDNSTPTSNEIRSVRRSGRPRPRYVSDAETFLSGIHPILTWGRNHRNNTATTSASNNVQASGQGNGVSDVLAGQIRVGIDGIFDSLERRDVSFDRARESIIQPPSSSASDSETILSTASQSTISQPDELLLTPIGNIPFFRNLEGQFILVDLFMLLARNWTLHDLLNLNTVGLESSIVQNPVSRNTVTLVNFVLNRIMCNQPINAQTVDQAAHRIYLEMVSYINIFCSVPTRTNINISASFLRCISYNLRLIAVRCEQHRGGITSDILTPLTMLAERLLSLIVYCCDSRAVFRLIIGALMQILPLPTSLHRLILDEVRMNVDHYWDSMMMNGSIVDYIVPSNDLEVGQTSRVENEEPSSIPTLPSSDIVNEPLPEVVIGSQEWHNSVPSEWVPVISRDSQRQRRQGTQPPYSDAYLSGMPNKRRKIVTSSKPQGPLSQIIAKNLEVAMGAAGVAINKEVTANVGADSEVQNAYTEHIRMFGRSGLDTHPDFCPDRYPNASKFFYNRNHPN